MSGQVQYRSGQSQVRSGQVNQIVSCQYNVRSGQVCSDLVRLGEEMKRLGQHRKWQVKSGQVR